MYCQLEKSDKVFAYHGLEEDYCDKHKNMPINNSNLLDYIDDGIDLDKEQDEIYNEIETRNRKDYPKGR